MMGKFKKYEKYQPTGISWLDEIPKHWAVKKGKYLFKIRKRIVGGLGYDVLSITQKGIKIKDIKSGGGQLAMDYSKYQLANEGDFAMNHMDLLTGFVDISKFKGVISPDYRVFTLEDKESYDKYFLYLFQMGYRSEIFFAYGQGSSQLGRWRLPASAFNNFIFPCPNKSEQIAIVDFLDKRVAQIDHFIELKEKAILYMQEQLFKLSINGLNENEKPIQEWMDNFPDNWTKLKAKWLFEEIKIKNRPDEELLAATQDRGVLPKKMCEQNFVSPSESSLGSLKFVPKKSFVISLRSFQGGIEFSKYQGIVSPAYNIFKLIPELDNEKMRIFYKYFFKTKPFIELLNTIITGIRDGQNINYSDFSTLIVPIPDKGTLDKMSLIDEKLKRTKIVTSKEIALIKEYRASLISAAVTGKIDVRAYQKTAKEYVEAKNY